MCLFFKIDVGDAIDIISCIIAKIMGIECFEKCFKGQKGWLFAWRLLAFIIGVGFDILGFYINYGYSFFSLNSHP